jgi:glycosyltransferase involved in cell wall biosynthesis
MDTRGLYEASLSIIVPLFNEQDNVAPLCGDLLAVLTQIGRSFEIILINDGSSDGTEQAALGVTESEKRVKLISLLRNFGQTAAVMAGIDHAKGDIIITIDGDQQNDPRDIPLLLAKLDEGFDVVSGWRKGRKDHAVTKKLPSFVANKVISWISGVHLRDYGCTLKAYRREVIKGIRLYGEMHRFVPIYCTWQGGKVAEIPVRHNARMHGKSNYGLERILKVVLDIVVVTFLDKYATRPIHLFGIFGLLTLLLGVIAGAGALYFKFVEGIHFIRTPLPLLAVFCFVTGIMSILLGLLAELVMRTYFESQAKSVYLVRSRQNLD